MQCWGLRAVVLVLWTSVAATLSSTQDEEPSGDRKTFIQGDPALSDPLWLEYGLNASEEYKYFHEPGHDDTWRHYDIRFFSTPVDDTARGETQTHMARAYLHFFEANNLETWIAHGTLLGWWWNGKILPWDWDMDMQVPDTTLSYLAEYYNQTIVQYSAPDSTVRRYYLLDINPWCRQRKHGKGHNIIDARWIDIDTGLFIDITGLSRLEPYNNPDIWQCKNFHKYPLGDIYPLRWTTFEGVNAKVPFRYELLLIKEYSEKALTSTRFHGHTWLPDLTEWVSDETAANFTINLSGLEDD